LKEIKNFRDFESAREFVRKLGLKNYQEWREYAQTNNKPKDIPSAPNTVYKNKGWISSGDWLGNGVVAYKYKTWKTFEVAKHFAISLNLQSFEEWKKYCKSGNKPDDIPDIPSNIYKNKGWISWPDFLGNSRIVKYTKSNTRPFEECKKFVRALGVTTGSEWFKWCKKNKKPDNIPTYPDSIYKEWTTWRDFLGPLPEKWKSFEDAREFARSLKLKNPGEWNDFSKSGKRPADIPAGPAETYKKQGKWIGWSDFLGTGNLTSKQLREQYYSHEDAKKYVQKQGIKTVPKFNEWSSQGERPIFIPANPHKFYKDWIDWDDFFGREKIVRRSFEDAREFARSLNLQFSSDWFTLHKEGKIQNIPRYPNEPYKKEWKGWGDFLGTGNLSPSDKRKQMRSYEECKKFVRSLGIKTENQWRDWCTNNQRPVDIPYSFERSYPDEWNTMGEFLGTGFVADKNKVWMSFEKARTIVQKLGLKNMDEYKKEWNLGKISKHIPANPNKVYQNKGWESNGDWLGTGTISGKIKSKNWLKWKDAKPKYAMLSKKYGLKNSSDWKKFTPKHQRELNELNIPAKPWIVYSKERIWRKMK
jgi:hypothetical protein